MGQQLQVMSYLTFDSILFLKPPPPLWLIATKLVLSKQKLMKELGSCPVNSSQVARKVWFLPKEAHTIHISISYCFL